VRTRLGQLVLLLAGCRAMLCIFREAGKRAPLGGRVASNGSFYAGVRESS